MKLILSSRDFHEDAPRAVIEAHLPGPAERCKVLFIPNEHATPENLKNDMYNRRLRQKGFARGNIHVFDHTRPRDFEDLPLDVIYISGGNTFRTLQKLRDSGFDRALTEYIRRGVLYIGGSAGAHIVSKSVAHAARYDEVPEGFEDFSGLGLVDAVFVCHYGPEREEHYRELCAAGGTVIALTDAQSVVVEDGKITCYGFDE